MFSDQVTIESRSKVPGCEVMRRPLMERSKVHQVFHFSWSSGGQVPGSQLGLLSFTEIILIRLSQVQHTYINLFHVVSRRMLL